MSTPGAVKAYKSYKATCTVLYDSVPETWKQKRKFGLNEPVRNEPSIEVAVIVAETARNFINSSIRFPYPQQIIRLYLEGKSNKEIAAQLNIEPDTVTRQRLRAIMALRKLKFHFD